ncbi:hypothetical protein CTAYLR_001278 [Chrysophaeum taylorii]|uniref:CBS domain-containing protein n=1 Tax=Chrysophaeum taylorii TaxID=2483200 RepID=A0AAD7UCL8_9STRA|nr:hypothetical protein CTAYLR_001278 [Chrysophaeum taylorii]
MSRFPQRVTELMQGARIADILSHAQQVPVTIDADLNAAQASGVLAKHAISSAPVRSKDGGFCGMFDFGDLAELLICGMQNNPKPLASDQNIDALLESGLSMSSPVHLVSDLSKRNPLVAVKDTESVLDAVNVLVDRSIHRLCVFDEAGTFVGMLSFSDVLKFLHANMPAIDEFAQATVDSLGLATKRVATICGDRPVVDALRIMVDRKVSSVAVVDEVDGRLLTAITLTDCKNLVKMRRLEHMRLDCREFAAQIRARQALDNLHGSEAFPFFAVHRETTLKSVIAKLVAVRAHRLFVVDDGKPVSVISISDIVLALAHK